MDHHEPPSPAAPAPLLDDPAWLAAPAAARRRGACGLCFRGQPRHVESYFLKANDPQRGRALWLRFTVLAPAKDPDVVEVWGIVFDKETGRHRACKETFPLREAQLAPDRLRFCIGKCRLEDGWTRGELRGPDGRAIRWDLRFEPTAAGEAPLALFPSPRFYRNGGFPRTKTVTPIPDARFDGEIAVDDDAWSVASWPGLLGHNWGREHAHRYAWTHVNAFDGAPGTYVEAISAKVRVGPFPLPFLTVAFLQHDGRAYDFRGITHWYNRSVEVGLYRYRFRARGPDATLDLEVEAASADLVGLVYQDPDGQSAFCLNTKVARARARLTRPDGSLLADLVTSERAALELLVRDRDHGIRVLA